MLPECNWSTQRLCFTPARKKHPIEKLLGIKSVFLHMQTTLKVLSRINWANIRMKLCRFTTVSQYPTQQRPTITYVHELCPWSGRLWSDLQFRSYKNKTLVRHHVWLFQHFYRFVFTNVTAERAKIARCHIGCQTALSENLSNVRDTLGTGVLDSTTQFSFCSNSSLVRCTQIYKLFTALNQKIFRK